MKNCRYAFCAVIILCITAVFISCTGTDENAADGTVSESVISESVSDSPSLNEQTYETEASDDPYIKIPKIVLLPADSLPGDKEDALFSASAVGMNPTMMFFDDSLTFYFDVYIPDSGTREYYTGQLTLPEGYTFCHIQNAERGGGSGETFVIVEAEKGSSSVYLTYGFFCTEPPTAVYVSDDIK